MQTQIRDIEYFAKIAEYGQIQRAAAALGLSQPALSKSLRRLEHAMNAQLLMRTPKGVELTTVGKALLSRFERLRMALDDIIHEAADLSEARAGHIHVGTGPDLSLNLLPSAAAALLREAPKATITVTVGTSDVLLPAVSRGELDLTVTASSFAAEADLVSEPLLDEEYVVYCSASHALAKKKHVTLADLARERWALAVSSGPMIQRDLHRIFAAEGLPAPKVAVETNSVTFRMRLVADTELLGFLPKRAIHERLLPERLQDLRLKGLSYRRTVAVYRRKDAYLSPVGRRFIDILKQQT